jgi:hypothetical protein
MPLDLIVFMRINLCRRVLLSKILAFRRLVATENRLRDKRWCQLFRLVFSAADANGILVWGYTNGLGLGLISNEFCYNVFHQQAIHCLRA